MIIRPNKISKKTKYQAVEISVQLMGMFKDKAPAGNKVELEQGATIANLLSMLQIDPGSIHMVMHNSKPEKNFECSLNQGDTIMVLSPVAGG